MPNRVASSQPYTCPGVRVRPGTLWRRTETITRHDQPVAAVMVVYQDGAVEIACPICGRYALS